MAERNYYRVGPAVWDEPWDDDTRFVALYLLTCRHRTTEGLFRLPLEYACADIGWPLERFRKGFDQLLGHGFIAYDEAARCCLIVKALEWQSPENPNQVKSALKKLSDLPRTSLFDRLLASADRHCERFAQALRERFAERFGEGLAEPIAEPQAPSQAQAPSPSPAQNGAAPDGAHADEKRITVDHDALPDDFPGELVQVLDQVVPILEHVAGAKRAIAVARAGVARTIAARPLKPHVRAAADFETYWLHGKGAQRGMKDVVASYRNWLDNENDMAPATNGHTNGASRLDDKFAGLKA